MLELLEMLGKHRVSRSRYSTELPKFCVPGCWTLPLFSVKDAVNVGGRHPRLSCLLIFVSLTLDRIMMYDKVPDVLRWTPSL